MAFFSSAIAGAVSAATGLAWLGSVAAGAVQVAVGIGASLIAKAIAGDQQAGTQRFGVQGQLQGGDDVPRSILFGRTCTAGSLVYWNTWGVANGTTNGFHTRVVALADYPAQAMLRVFVEDLAGTLLTGSPHAQYGWPIAEFRKNGVDHMWVKFYDGTQTTADTFLTGSVASAERPYDAGRVGRGIPYAIVTCMAPERIDGEDKPLFSSGPPAIKFEMNGARLYDPSRDSSVGGVGTQRLANPATWGGDGDHLPIVQAYALMLGITYNGQWLYGLQGINVNRVPVADVIAQINKCRIPFQGPEGMEPQYRSGGELQVGAQIKTAIEALLTSCQGRMIETAGTYKFRVGAPDAPVFSFNDGVIISTEEQSFTPFFGLEDSINGIQSTYPNPNEGWATKTAPPIHRSDLELLDGNRRLMASVSLDMVYSIGQVERLQKSALEEAQRARRHTYVLGPEAWVLEPGDIIEWTSERNGYINKLFRVDGLADRADLDILVDMTEVDPADYDWDFDEDFTGVVDGPIQIVGPQPLPMIGWQAYGVEVLDNEDRARRPGIEVWYQPGLSNIEFVRVQVRMPDAASPFIDIVVNYGSPWRTQIVGNLINNTEYEVRGVYMTYDRTLADWSDWLLVLTPNTKFLPGLDFDPFEGVVDFENLGPALTEWTTQMGMTNRELIAAIQETANYAADQEAANSLQFQEVRHEMGVSLGQVSANFLQTITVAIVPLQNSVVALADYLTQLSAGDGSDVSTARFRMTTLSGPTGYSRIGAQTRVDTADPLAWRGAAWYLDTPNDPLLPTRFLVEADQFIVVSNGGATEAQMMIFDGTALRVNNLLVRTASMADLSVTTAKIDDLAVKAAKIDNLAVTTGKIDNLAVTTGKIANLAVNTLQIAGNAVTVPAYAATSGDTTIVPAILSVGDFGIDPYFTTVQTVAITVTGGDIFIDCSLSTRPSSSGDYCFIGGRLLRNGSEIRRWTFISSGLGNPYSSYAGAPPVNQPQAVPVYDPGLGAGTYTYTLQVAAARWISGDNIIVSNRQLRAFNRLK